MPFDVNSVVEDKTSFERPESLPDGDYEVTILETDFQTEANRREVAAKRQAEGYDAKEPSGPMGIATYQVQSGELQGGVVKDYFWLRYMKDGVSVPSKEQYQRVQALLRVVGVLDTSKKLTGTQVESGLQKAMTQVKGRGLIITTRRDKNDMARIVAYARAGSNAQTAIGESTEEVPF